MKSDQETIRPLKSAVGDRFTVVVGDTVILMEVTGLRCGDVWDCHPVEESEKIQPMVFTEAEVLRINRNVLYMLQRNEVARRILDRVYRHRALRNQPVCNRSSNLNILLRSTGIVGVPRHTKAVRI